MEFHTFVICAYGESPYLEACIRSLLSQTEKSRILCATSTPGPGCGVCWTGIRFRCMCGRENRASPSTGILPPAWRTAGL